MFIMDGMHGELTLYNRHEEYNIPLKQEQLEEVIEFLKFKFTSIEPESISFEMLTGNSLKIKNKIVARNLVTVEVPEGEE